jgi:glycosyltransferase involved in cell wall biosynthesis
MPKFSIILPVYSELEPVQSGASGMTHFRGKSVQRAIKSVMAQQFTDWELIIVDDGCVDGVTPRILDAFADMDKRIKVIHKQNENRAIARNTGMDAAVGEWICWLDSDDEYSTHYLRELDQAIKEFPEYKIFNFRSMYHYPDHHTLITSLFEPAIEETGHEWFRAGHLTCGSFIFNRELWNSDKKYRIPDEASPFSFASESKFPYKLTREEDQWKYDNTENPEGMFQDGVFRQGSSLGNPWGDDFIQAYLLTRDNIMKPLDVILYVIYPRGQEDTFYEHYGEVFDVTSDRESG